MPTKPMKKQRSINKKTKVVSKEENTLEPIGSHIGDPPEPEPIEPVVEKILPKIDPVVSIRPSRENDRVVSIEFVIHAPAIKFEDIKDITFQVLKDSVDGVKKVIEEAVGQEQKFLDATRQ